MGNGTSHAESLSVWRKKGKAEVWGASRLALIPEFSAQWKGLGIVKCKEVSGRGSGRKERSAR